MAITNSISIVYNSTTIGGSSNDYLLDGPYSITKTHATLQVTFAVQVVSTTVAGCQALAATLETALAARDKSLSITMGGNTWTYTHGTHILNTRASLTKSADRDKDRGASRGYLCTIEGELPASDQDGLRDMTVHVEYTPSRQKAVTLSGVYTSLSGATASAQYATDIDGEASTILTGVDGSATWELVHENTTRDRNNHSLSFQRQYLQLLENQSAGVLNDTQIRDHKVSFTDLSQHPGDSLEDVTRLRRLVATYDCSVDIAQTTDLQAVAADKLVPILISTFRTRFNPQVFGVEDKRIGYDETSKRVSISMTFVYQKSGGSTVVEYTEGLLMRETRQIDYTPVHNGDELAAYADPGWMVRERIYTRTSMIVGVASPNHPGDTNGDLPPIGSAQESGAVGGASSGSVEQSGWNVIQATSEATPVWIGDPDHGDRIRMTVVRDTIVSRYNSRPSRAGGGGRWRFSGA